MSQKSISGKSLKDAITSDDILGKEVIDLAGKEIGIAEKVFIDPNSLDFIGINIDKGFLKKDLSIGKNYIQKVAKHAVFLNIRVSYELKGLEVFSELGESLGKVSGIELEGIKNDIKVIYVRKGLFTKETQIPMSFVDKIGFSVLLKVKKDQVEDFNKSLEVN